MTNSVSLQYAKAIFDLACESSNEQTYYDSLVVIKKVIFEDEDVCKTFSHPKIETKEKKEILNNVLKDKIDLTLLHYLFVLLDNNRFLELPLIVESYKELLDNHLGKMEVKVYSKYELDEKQRKDLKKSLKEYYKKDVIINEYIDTALIGGIKIEAAGQVLDSTVLLALDNLKNSLKKGW